MVLCGTKNGSSMASLEEPPLFLRVYVVFIPILKIGIWQHQSLLIFFNV